MVLGTRVSGEYTLLLPPCLVKALFHQPLAVPPALLDMHHLVDQPHLGHLGGIDVQKGKYSTARYCS